VPSIYCFTYNSSTTGARNGRQTSEGDYLLMLDYVYRGGMIRSGILWYLVNSLSKGH